MPFSQDDLQTLETMIARAVGQGLNNIGLGADTAAEVTELRADFIYVRLRRLAAQGFWRNLTKGVATGVGVALFLGFLYVVAHAGDFEKFAAAFGSR